MKKFDKIVDGYEIPPEFFDFLKAMDPPKYTKGSWKEKDCPSMQFTRNIGSVLSHLSKVLKGENIDEESGLPHLIHAITRLQMAHYRKERGIDK